MRRGLYHIFNPTRFNLARVFCHFAFNGPVILAILLYRTLWLALKNSFFPGAGCRYDPSCSSYALEAFGQFGFFRAMRLVLSRLLRCHPWGGQGYDPLPPASVRKSDHGPA